MIDLCIGSKGLVVQHIQYNLKMLGYYDGKIDGDFGPITQKSVIEFQKDNLITGCVDGGTYLLLEDTCYAKKQFIPIPKTRDEVIKIFGDIKYIDTSNGNIKITNRWATDNLSKVDLPIVGKRYVHKKLKEIFIDILSEIEKEGLSKEIKQFGTWAPRHILHNAKKPLSLHSWGIACDINWSTNKYGTKGNMNQKIIQIFEKYGFIWGGNWKSKDPMHFQYTE